MAYKTEHTSYTLTKLTKINQLLNTMKLISVGCNETSINSKRAEKCLKYICIIIKQN